MSSRGHVIKCCNHLLAVNMTSVACRGLWCMWLKKLMTKDIGLGKVLWGSSYFV